MARGLMPTARQALHSFRGTRHTLASIQADLEAARLHYLGLGMDRDIRRLAAHAATLRDGFQIPWETLYPASSAKALDYAAILKAPSDGERGVLLVCFEHNFVRLARHADLGCLARDYDLVVSPTWSPPFDLAIMLLAARWPRKLITMLSNFADETLYPRFVPNTVAVPLLASSWVHPDLMTPSSTPVRKTVDLVMLANFGVYKRHFALFRALRRVKRPLRVRLMGVPMDGRTGKDIQRMALDYGVDDRVEVIESPSDEALRHALQEAYAAVILSRREGSCIAVAEMIMMNLPVLMLRDAHVGSKAFITSSTGLLVDEPDLPRGLEEIVDRAPTMSPRESLLRAGVDCFTSTRTLNEHMRRRAIDNGEPWTRDILPHAIVRLAPAHASERDAAAVADAYRGFGDRYGVGLPSPRYVGA
jgi:glycosyltransferase involved in cell wall biosynthesis